MKILYAYFKNFQGFYTGLNLTELKLNFNKGLDTAFNVIFGKNASGKSTLLSILQPFPGTNDNRNDIIMEGKEGKKEITYLTKNGIYKISIIYPEEIKGKRPTEKCFLYKMDNGSEEDIKEGKCCETKWVNLNPNGGKVSYITAIEEHLGITKDFFMVGRIGGVENFIDLNKSDRKKFISNFLPEIDPYLEANETVSKKYTLLKKMITTYGDEIKSLISEEECIINLSKIKDEIKSNSEKLEEYNQKFGASKGIVDNILNETSKEIPELREFARTGLNPFAEEIEDISIKLNKLKSNIVEDYDKDKANNELSKETQNILSFTEDKAKAETELASSLREKESAEASIKGIESRLESVSTKIGLLDNLKNTLSAHEKTLEELNKEKSKYTANIYKNFHSMTPEVMNTFKMLVMEINITLNNEREAYLQAGLNSLSLNDKTTINTVLFNLKTEMKKAKSTLERVDEYRNKLPYLEANARSEEVLKNRPAGCSINTCPFIVSALEYEGSSLELKRVRKFLDGAAEEIEKANYITENNEPKIKFLENFEEYFVKNIQEKFSTKPLLRLYPKILEITTNIDKYIEILSTSTSEYTSLMDISHIDDFVNHKYNVEKTKSEIERIKERINEISESSGFINNLQSDLEKAKNNLSEIEDKYSRNDGKFKEATEKLQKAKDKQTSLKLMIQSFDMITDKENKLENLNLKVKMMEKYTNDIENHRSIMIECNKEKALINAKIDELNREKEKLNHQLESRRDLENKLKELNSQFKTVETVKRCTDIVKGIPVYLIDSYLEDIRQKTNELLQIAYKGDFTLDKFVLNEKEFSIPVIRGNGSRLEDIKEGSGAEKSLVKSSLSFAIIQKALSDYNILYLDEIDGCLDENKRREFISMLRKQVEDLGIDQVFLISHNREFLDEELNLILLKDHGIDVDDDEMMKNKAVIYNYYK